MYHLVECFSD